MSAAEDQGPGPAYPSSSGEVRGPNVGRKNIYVCDTCRGHIVTVDRDKGVTPFAILCRATKGCGGLMQSSMYRVFDQRIRAGFEWYEPTETELVTESPATRAHVARGGLLLREALADDP